MELWHAKEVAFFLGLSLAEVEGLRQEGQLQAVRRWPRRWLYESESVIAYHAKRSAAEPKPDVSSQPNVSFEEVVQLAKELQAEVDARGYEDEEANAAPLVRMVNAILSNAIDMGATDIYFAPGRRVMQVRFRVAGTLGEVLPIPRELQRNVARRLMVMADLDVVHDHLPQTGRILLRHNNENWSVRVAAVSGVYGPILSARLLTVKSFKGGLEGLGMSLEQVGPLEHRLASEPGLYLFIGPPGSGKTTTAMACLCALKPADRAIYTLEEPIEYELSGISSLELNPARGKTLTKLLPAVLKASPDVLFFGSIHDQESARAALAAAEAGVTVLATLPVAKVSDVFATLERHGLPHAAQLRLIRVLVHQSRAGESIHFTMVHGEWEIAEQLEANT